MKDIHLKHFTRFSKEVNVDKYKKINYNINRDVNLKLNRNFKSYEEFSKQKYTTYKSSVFL